MLSAPHTPDQMPTPTADTTKEVSSTAKKGPISLPLDTKVFLAQQVKQLKKLHETIANKEVEIQKKTIEIKDRFEKIRQSKDVQTRTNIGAIFEKAARDYTALIVQAVHEISFYVTFYEKYLDGTSEQLQKISVDMPEMVASHVEHQAKLLKKYIKRREKEFKVFFSRYDHGFNTHINKISAVEKLIKDQAQSSH